MTPAPFAGAGDLVLTPRGLRFHGRDIPCCIGRAGTSRHKREGDGTTPVGRHRIAGCLYRPDRMARPNRWAVPIRPGDLWCDDPGHARYNRLVRAPFASSHEALHRADRLYDLVLLTDWNLPDPIPGRGSAIFLHRWRRPGHPSAGCIVMAPGHLHRIARAVVPGTRLIVQPLAPKMAEPTRT